MVKEKSGNWFTKHKVLTIAGVIIILIIISAIASGGSKPTSTPTASTASKSSSGSSSKTPATTTSTPTLNQPANDGKFQFTITSFQCGVSQIEQPDDSDYVVTSGAPYCEMSLSVKDIGNVAQDFDSDSQYLYSSSKNQYSVDDTATIAANDTSSQFMEDPTVNPGVTLTGTLAFDIPAGVTPTYAVLHDSSLSNGVKVNLQ